MGPWDWYISLHEWWIFYGQLVGKYTVPWILIMGRQFLWSVDEISWNYLATNRSQRHFKAQCWCSLFASHVTYTKNMNYWYLCDASIIPNQISKLCLVSFFCTHTTMNCQRTLFKLEFIGWFDSYIFLQAEPFILKDADLKKQPSFHRYVFFFSKGCFFLSSCFHTANTCFNFGIYRRGQQTCRKISLGRWAQLCRTVWNAQQMGFHQGFSPIVSEGFHFLVLWDVYLLKQTTCWLLDLKVFRKNHMKCFLNMFWAVKRYDYGSSFFVTKGVAVISVSTM